MARRAAAGGRVLRLLFVRLFICLVVADRAAGTSTEKPMALTDEVPGNAADHRTLETARCVRSRNGRCQRQHGCDRYRDLCH